MNAMADPAVGSDAAQASETARTERTKATARTAALSSAGEQIKDPLTSEAGPSASGEAVVDWQEEGEGASPVLTLDGFSGPLDHLLTLARAQKIDLARISLTTLVEQLTAALRHASEKIPLGQKADWVVMAAWLVQLRARLLLPADAPVQQEAAAEVEQLRTRLGALQAMRALAGWLEQRPELGQDVFARGRPPSRAHWPSAPG
jgi:segregation and condensation protein A